MATGDSYSRMDILTLKGMAITAIVLHNFFHHLPGALQENEFVFHPDGYSRLLSAMGHPCLWIPSLFSYCGHFGVQVFIFASAYGLARKYRTKCPPWAEFFWGRIRKLHPMVILAIALWVLHRAPAGHLLDSQFWRHDGLSLGLVITGLQTLIPFQHLPPVGPWWFIPFIMQFYALWPLLDRLRRRYGRQGLLLFASLGAALVLVANGILVAKFAINLLLTPLGHAPEIALGIYLAEGRALRSAWILVSCALVFLLGNVLPVLFPFTFPAILDAFNRIPWPRPVSCLARWIGGLSLPIFLVNGYTRNPLLALTGPHTGPGLEEVLALLALLAAVGLAYILYRILEGVKRFRAACPPQ